MSDHIYVKLGLVGLSHDHGSLDDHHHIQGRLANSAEGGATVQGPDESKFQARRPNPELYVAHLREVCRGVHNSWAPRSHHGVRLPDQ